MENLLNKSHPFRASVTHTMGETPAAAAPAAVAEGGEAVPASYRRNWFTSLPLKKKLGLIALVGVVIGWGYMSLFDLANAPSPERSARKKKRPEVIAMDTSRDEPGTSREELGNRSVEKAWASAGFLHRLLCRGGERRSFCQ